MQLSSFHFLQNNSKVCFTNLLANDFDTIKEQTKIVRVDQREDTHLVTHSTTVPRIGIGVGSSGSTNEGDGTITAANITNGIGKVIWTRKDTATTANVFNIGYPHVIGTENVDLTRNGRVAFIELEAVGIGPIGDLHLAGSDRTYFGRCQLDAGYLALTLNNDSMVGEYEFDNFVKPREMVIRLRPKKRAAQDNGHAQQFSFGARGGRHPPGAGDLLLLGLDDPAARSVPVPWTGTRRLPALVLTIFVCFLGFEVFLAGMLLSNDSQKNRAWTFHSSVFFWNPTRIELQDIKAELKARANRCQGPKQRQQKS